MNLTRTSFLLFAFCLQLLYASGQPVNASGSIHIGGIDQYTRARSADAGNPLLLFLHGGPGGSVMSYASKFTSKLEKSFIVVHWDQRETGRTKDLNSSTEPLSFELYVRDTHELIDSLLRRYHKSKLYLVGHSWGTAIGFQVALRHPELLHAWISIGSMVHQAESERIILDAMIKKAEHEKSEGELEELKSIAVSFQDGHQLYLHRKHLFKHVGNKAPFTETYVTNWASTWLKVFNEASAVNLFESGKEIGCPVYFFAGLRDHQTSSALAEKYYNTLIAPDKDFFWFMRSGHGIPNSEPDRLQDLITAIRSRVESKSIKQTR